MSPRPSRLMKDPRGVTPMVRPWPRTILKQLEEWDVIVSCDQFGETFRVAPTLLLWALDHVTHPINPDDDRIVSHDAPCFMSAINPYKAGISRNRLQLRHSDRGEQDRAYHKLLVVHIERNISYIACHISGARRAPDINISKTKILMQSYWVRL